MMASDDSDIELQSALPKTSTKKTPKSPSEDILKKKQEKKITTKHMINKALIDLKSRKGVSLYAIKKYITEKYSVDTEKINYHIKKYIKSAVEEGTILQTKGVGASGSFKLAPIKEKKPKSKKIPKEKSENAKLAENKKKLKENVKKTENNLKTKSKKDSKSDDKTVKKKKAKILEKDKMPKDKEKKGGDEKVKKVRIAKGMQTPSKKKGIMMKRKSIGSIIKPPKMKPAKSKVRAD